MRKGPNVVGPFGMFQSFADFLKFVLKEIVIPAGADKVVFLLAPLISFTLAFGAWAVMPLAPGWVVSNINVGVLYLFAISSLGVYGIIMGGWASNSKYPFLGSLRSAAQMVSYEVSIGFVIITVILLSGSLNLQTIVERQAGGFWNWNVLGGGGLKGLPAALVMLPMSVIFFISALAETNRPPFDLPEAESELVAGYQVEYSSTPYLLFMIGEYANIVLMCAMISVLFFGGWQPLFPTPFTASWAPGWASFFYFMWFYLKIIFFFFMFAMVKAIVPRYRYDQLMRLGWKVFLPTSIAAVVAIAAWRVFGPAA
jgi:NADH-quinone oxidoreductase subunit H